jgi:hypothetical protein
MSSSLRPGVAANQRRGNAGVNLLPLPAIDCYPMLFEYTVRSIKLPQPDTPPCIAMGYAMTGSHGIGEEI